ncbi:uncharacterized protein LOC122939454 [Bufo gargarizans]|uniref:uncharacterized protein LOC122939454 n=1 Tax=Bufo gargarizans TaxID=30331 RepID=UPI001CF3E4F9|nr:uncharacterized protein LOC122939454 [Bufo gargarizans]
MANRQLLGPSKGMGSGKNVTVAGTSSNRRKRGGSSRSNRPQLPLSYSTGSSDTTLSWHGPGTAPMPSPVQNLPIAFAAPSPSQVMIATGTAPLFSDNEFCEDSQQLQANPDLEERSAADSFRRATTDDDSWVGAHVARGQRHVQETGEGDTSDDQTFIDDDVADCTWKLEEEEASSSSEGKVAIVHMRQQGGCVSISQQGGSSGRSGAKRGRGTPSATQKTTCEEHTSNAWVHKSSGRQPSCGGGGKIPYSAVWEFFTKSLGDVSVAVCRMCGQKVRRGQGANVGTTALRQHMERHHKVAWENRANHLVLQHDAATAASPTGLHPLSSSQGLSTSAEGSYPSFPSTAKSIAPDAPTPTPYHVFRQQSITEAIAKRQQYVCTHPTAQKLNVHLAKLLVLQSLPFHHAKCYVVNRGNSYAPASDGPSDHIITEYSRATGSYRGSNEGV